MAPFSQGKEPPEIPGRFTHDWEREERPPVLLYQPFVSAYQAIDAIGGGSGGALPEGTVCRSALSLTFRLPPVIRELIARVYRLDEIVLEGLERDRRAGNGAEGLGALWEGRTGLFRCLHEERESRRSNTLEASIIEGALEVAPPLPSGSVAVMTPHRAQRSLLRTRLSPYAETVDLIDTVERLQGGERPTVIFSATASEPVSIASNAEFILDLNRSNVAFSRAESRLIVVCSSTLLDHVPADVERYESMLLWKALRALCTRELGRRTVDGHEVRVLAPPLEAG